MEARRRFTLKHMAFSFSFSLELDRTDQEQSKWAEILPDCGESYSGVAWPAWPSEAKKYSYRSEKILDLFARATS